MKKASQPQHYLIAGKTGSGKSIFGLMLLHRYFLAGWRIIIIDVENKQELFTDKPERSTITRPYRYDGSLKAQVTYYSPDIPGWKDPVLEKLYTQALAQRYVFVYHDEIIGIASANQYPNGLVRLYSQGRKRHVVGAICTQRPVSIPRIVTTQAGILVAFRIPDAEDRHVMALRMHTPEIEEIGAWKEPYDFYLLNELTMDRAKYYRALKRKDVLRRA